jgi:hypothetical protein
MNRIESHVLLRLAPVWGGQPKNRGHRIASNARSPVGSTPETWRFRGQSQQARADGDELTAGFLRYRRTKRMMRTKKEGPVSIPETRPSGHSSRPRLVIPRWVAPLQSPTPFRQATSIILQVPGVRLTSRNGNPSCAKPNCRKHANQAKTGRTRSPAPAPASRPRAHDYARNDGLSFDPFHSIGILSTERRAHLFTCRH